MATTDLVNSAEAAGARDVKSTGRLGHSFAVGRHEADPA